MTTGTKPAVLRDPPKRVTKAKRKEIANTFMTRMHEIEPDPKCELFYKTQYQLLVSVVLSAQTTDKMVNRCMEPVYKTGFKPEDVVEMGQSGLLKIIRRIGLAPTKSKNVTKLSQMLLDLHKGRVPKTREELEALPGVGRKTANVILGELFKHPTLAVDTHVFRVTRRLGLHNEKTADKCEKVILESIDLKHLPAGHHWLILHGRYVCTAKNPQCEKCTVNDICPSYI